MPLFNMCNIAHVKPNKSMCQKKNQLKVATFYWKTTIISSKTIIY